MNGRPAMPASLALLTSILLTSSMLRADIITSVAGGGDSDLPALDASIDSNENVPVYRGEVAIHPSWGTLVIAGNRVFRITPNGRLFVVAGNGVAGYSGDGHPATEAMLDRPQGIAVDTSGNLYIVDQTSHRVRKVDGVTGIITTYAGTGQAGFSGDGGPATTANIGYPSGVAVDPEGHVYVSTGHRVRRIAAGSGLITTVAGTGNEGYSGDGGPAAAASFRFPGDLESDAAGNLVLIDRGNHVVRRIDRVTGTISTVAGNGTILPPQDGVPATSLQLSFTTDLGIDGLGAVLICDSHRVLRVDPGTGLISIVAGNGSGTSGDGGPATQAGLTSPIGVAADPVGNIFIRDSNRVRRVDAVTRIIDTIAGLGTLRQNPEGHPATRLELHPDAVAVGPTGDLYFTEAASGWIVRRVDAASGLVETVAGGGTDTAEDVPALGASLQFVRDLEFDRQGNLHIVEGGYYVEPGPYNEAGFFGPNRVRRIDAATGCIRTVAGGGGLGADGVPATFARLVLPVDISFDGAGSLYIAEGADFSNGPNGGMKVRRVNASDGLIFTVAGNGSMGPPTADGELATDAYLAPWAVAADPVTGDFFIAERGVRRVSVATGIITTVADLYATALAVNEAGVLFIGEEAFDQGGGRVWRLDPADGTLTPYAGSGLAGLGGDGGPALDARLSGIAHMGVDPGGRLVISDIAGLRIRQVGLGGLANRPPSADAGEDGLRGCASSGTSITLDGSASSDPDGNLASYEWYRDFGRACETLVGTGATLGLVLPPGSHDFTLRVEDSRGLSDFDDVHVEISPQDLEPPHLILALDPAILWPPWHQLLDVSALIQAGDDCGPPAVSLASIVTNEPDDAPGHDDGGTSDDVADADFGTDDRAFRLRAERDGRGTGRSYTVTYQARDASGKMVQAVADVFVPHDRSGKTEPVDPRVEETALGTRIAWEPVPGASAYDAVRGELRDIHVASQEIRLGTLRCVEAASADTSTAGHEDAERPPVGQAFFYLVQYDDGAPSGFGAEDASLPRDGNGGCR